MSTQTNTEVQHYLDRMREALADLPESEVAEIMDDAGAHVAEVAAEMGDEFSLAALVDRLGTPQAYAQELRAAAGYPAPSPAPQPASTQQALVARFALWSLVAGTVMAFGFALTGGDGEELTLLVGLVAAAGVLLVFRQRGLLAEVAALPETVALRTALARVSQSDVFKALTVFQPVWWIARVLLIGLAAIMVNREPVLTVLALALAALSVPAGPKAKKDRRWLWISLPATGFALGLLLFGAVSLLGRIDGYSPSPVSYVPQPTTPDNIYVFDKDGKPLTDVHLYDENGRPLNAPWYGCEGEDRHDNRFPRPRVVHDETGCHEEAGVPFTVVMPVPPAATGTTAVPTTAPSATTTTTPPSAPSAPTTTATTTTTG